MYSILWREMVFRDILYLFSDPEYQYALNVFMFRNNLKNCSTIFHEYILNGQKYWIPVMLKHSLIQG